MCVALYNDTLPWLVLPPVLTVIDIISYWFSPQTIFLNYFALELNFCSCFRFFSMQETNQFLSCCQEGDLKGIELTCRFLRTGRHFIYLFIYVVFFCCFFHFLIQTWHLISYIYFHQNVTLLLELSRKVLLLEFFKSSFLYSLPSLYF